MKIGIMGAMVEEIAPILDILKEYKTTPYGLNDYHEGTFNGIDIIVAYSKIGKVNSTITAMILCEHFKVDLIIFSGVAGSLSSKLSIGDIVLGEKLVQYDLDITSFGHPLGFVPEGSVFTTSDKALLDLAYNLSKNMDRKVVKGIIATGDKFISNSSTKSMVHDTFDADCIDMESASVSLVCSVMKIKSLVIRTISDNADSNAEENFELFLKKSSKISATYLFKICFELSKTSI